MRRRGSILSGFLVGAMLGCDNPVAPIPTRLSTDASTYVAAAGGQVGNSRAYTFTIVARFTNSGANTVYLPRCFPDTPYPVHSIEPVGRDTTAAYSPNWACPGPGYFSVAPGATRTDTLQVSSPWALDGRTGQLIGVLEGQFILVYEFHACPDETPQQCGRRMPGRARSGVFSISPAE